MWWLRNYRQELISTSSTWPALYLLWNQLGLCRVWHTVTLAWKLTWTMGCLIVCLLVFLVLILCSLPCVDHPVQGWVYEIGYRHAVFVPKTIRRKEILPCTWNSPDGTNDSNKSKMRIPLSAFCCRIEGVTGGGAMAAHDTLWSWESAERFMSCAYASLGSGPGMFGRLSIPPLCHLAVDAMMPFQTFLAMVHSFFQAWNVIGE